MRSKLALLAIVALPVVSRASIVVLDSPDYLSRVSFQVKPSPPPPPPPPPTQPTLYVNAGLPADATHAAQPQDTTDTWGSTAPYIFHPGTTPTSLVGWTELDAVIARANQIALEGGCNLKIAAYHGETLTYGLSAELVFGGNMGWASSVFGTISGLHFQSQFLSNVGNSNHKSFSGAEAYFGVTNTEMLACSIALEGIGGPAGIVDDQTKGGYSRNFTISEGWTANDKQILQAAYGVATVTPEPLMLWPWAIAIPLMKRPNYQRHRRRRARLCSSPVPMQPF